jgi:ribosomal protein L30E
VCVIIAEKCFEEVQTETEAYSLVSGVPIKDLILLEGKVLIFLDYRILP